MFLLFNKKILVFPSISFFFFPLSSEHLVFSGLQFPLSVHEYSLDHILLLPCGLDIHLRHLQKSYPLQLCPNIIFLVSFRLSWGCCLQHLRELKMVSRQHCFESVGLLYGDAIKYPFSTVTVVSRKSILSSLI